MNEFRIVDTLNESFALNERNKRNKRLKDAYVRSRGGRDNAPQGVYSDQEVYADNAHGSEGSERGVRRRGAKPSNDQVATHRLGLKRTLMAKHGHKLRKDESTMNQENFEEAFVRANAQIAFTIAEAMRTITAKPAEGHSPQHSTRGQSDQSGVERDSEGRRVIRAKPAKGHDPRYSKNAPARKRSK